MIAMCDVSTLILMQWTMALLLLCNALLFQITTFGFFIPGFMCPFERLQTEPQCPPNPTFSIDITSFLSYAFSNRCYPDRKHCLEALLMEQQLPDQFTDIYGASTAICYHSPASLIHNPSSLPREGYGQPRHSQPGACLSIVEGSQPTRVAEDSMHHYNSKWQRDEGERRGTPS